eukprot:scaffold24070_cov92-Amphora_coffeaeformis.AAC.3
MNATEVKGCGLVGLLLVEGPRENEVAEKEVLFGYSRGGGSDRMAESTSTPSASSHEVGPSSPPRGRGGSEDFYLSISSQPSSHVFSDEPFEVAFTLESNKASPSNSPPSVIRITARLVAEKSADLKLKVIEEPRLSLTRRSGRAKCCILCSEPLGKNRVSAKLHFTAAGVGGCTTDSITLVRAKLQVSVGDDWTDVWYKDEGGRDKSIETIVSAYDQQNNLLRDSIQLEIKLCYDSIGTPAVSNQDILKRLGSDRALQIDPKTGRAKVRYRVEDVSKNHQGQNFTLLISAAAKSNGATIAPAKTPPVNVRSKRNKRQRTGSARGSSLEFSMTNSGTAIAPPSSADRLGTFMSNEQLREAVQDVIRWSEEVVNGMYHIQWRVMGYASNADGSVDYNRPYHNMQNPNPVVDRLLALYNQSTRENIRYLQHTVVDPPLSPVEPYSMATRTPVPSMHHGSAMMPHSEVPPPPPHEMMGPSSPRGPYSTPQYTHGMPMHAPHPSEAYASSSPIGHYPQSHHHPDYYGGHHASAAANKTPHHDRLDPLPAHTGGGADSPTIDLESEVEYVLARQYKSLRTGERLGFPAYSVDRFILGFYRDSPRNAGLRQLIPISDEDFGPSEKLQAKKILDEAISSNSGAVQSVKECGSIASVLDRCLVYDFSKDIGGGGTK